ncbi:hypothetical protein E2C01_098684 [Portunus trituberculatus]|uniref:Uncharacterized protein n=1 Tax=Portunus trituberculatus TaxID=210409 RepID=A0A5B7K8B0_PORTR|nr:hypothetical protein [Portunus trituberculatus]
MLCRSGAAGKAVEVVRSLGRPRRNTVGMVRSSCVCLRAAGKVVAWSSHAVSIWGCWEGCGGGQVTG